MSWMIRDLVSSTVITYRGINTLWSWTALLGTELSSTLNVSLCCLLRTINRRFGWTFAILSFS